MALTAELTKYAMPPVNPYLGDRTIQYYWTYFLVPAVISEEGVGGLREIENSLKVNALCSGVLFIAALVIATWAVSLSAAGTAFAVVLAVVAASAEGLYAWWDLVSKGQPLAGLTDLNIDAMSAGHSAGFGSTAWCRSMWYNPQHSMSAALGLLAMPIVGAAGVERAHRRDCPCRPGTRVVDNVQSAHRRAVFAHLRRGGHRRRDSHAPAQTGAASRNCRRDSSGIAVGWCVGNDMVEGAAAVVLYGFGGYARNRPIATLDAVARAADRSRGAGHVAAMVAASASMAGGRRHGAGPARLLSRAPVGGRLVHRIPRGAVAAAGAARPRGTVLCAALAARMAMARRSRDVVRDAASPSVFRRRSSIRTTRRTSAIAGWGRGFAGRSR